MGRREHRVPIRKSGDLLSPDRLSVSRDALPLA
jgi:hypothetical protein